MAVPRPNPTDRAAARPSIVDSVGDLINHGLGNMVGGLIEKAKLGGKPGSGTYTASQTGARQQAATSNAFQNQRRTLNAAGTGTSDFEDLISGKKSAGMKQGG